MQKLIEAITAGAIPLITTALIAIIPALASYSVAWLKARTKAQEDAVVAAVQHVDAMRGPVVPMTGPEAKAAAVELVTQRMPSAVKNPEKLDALIELAVAKLPSVPPPAGDAP